MCEKLALKAVLSDRKLTSFMQACDVFEPFKVVGESVTLTVTLKPGCTIERAINDTRTVLERADSNVHVVAIFLPGNPTGAYRDPTVRVVSSGHKWTPLDSLLKNLGWVEPALASAL